MPRRRALSIPPSRLRLAPALEERVVFTLERAAAAIAYECERALRVYGLSLRELAALTALDASTSLPQSKLGAALAEDERVALRAMLRKLEPPPHVLGDLYRLQWAPDLDDLDDLDVDVDYDELD